MIFLLTIHLIDDRHERDATALLVKVTGAAHKRIVADLTHVAAALA